MGTASGGADGAHGGDGGGGGGGWLVLLFWLQASARHHCRNFKLSSSCICADTTDGRALFRTTPSSVISEPQ